LLMKFSQRMPKVGSNNNTITGEETWR